MQGPRHEARAPDGGLEGAVDLAAESAAIIAPRERERGHAIIPEAEIDARAEIGKPRPSLGVPLDRDSRRHAIAKACRADGVAVIHIRVKAIELAREAGFGE